MKTLSVVCAREGSKGLENKCVKRLKGRMVVEYAIQYSLSLGGDVKTVVSTDIEELIGFCDKEGVDYIVRGPRLSTDESKIDDALMDAIEKKGKGFDLCSLVYGNIPTRYPRIFREARDFLESHTDYEAVISMQNVEKFHPDWMLDFNSEILPRKKAGHYRRQMLPQKMIHDGHTLVFHIEGFSKRYKGLTKYADNYKYAIFGKKIKPLINEELIIDIDTSKDLKMAEAVLCCT